MNKYKLFLFPYALGNSYIYDNLKKHLNIDIQMYSLDYPGHGKKSAEKLLYTIEEISENLFLEIKNKLNNCDYALFGYSMGSLVCYEIYKLIEIHKLNKPKYIFLFACDSPDDINIYTNINNITTSGLKKTLLEYGDTAEELLTDEFVEYMLPIFEADFTAINNYKQSYKNINILFDCKVIVVRGIKEKLKKDSLCWKEYCANEYKINYIDGKHLFMFENEKNLIECAEIIGSCLQYEGEEKNE